MGNREREGYGFRNRERLAAAEIVDVPLVSIIIPTYNYGPFLADALKSCLEQTHPAVEVVVVDDGSTDDTRHVISPYQDRIVYIYQENQGVSAARNKGLEIASGDFVAFLDADDYLTPDAVETWLNAFSDHNSVDCAVTVTFSGRIDDASQSCRTKPLQEFVSEELSEMLLSRRLPFATCAVLTRSSVAKRFRFPIHLANGEDLVYFSKVFFRRKGCFLARPTAVTRSHQDSLRHRIEEIRKQGEALVDTIFDDPYYCGALDHLREDFTAYRYTEFFRRFYKAGDEKAAGRCLLKAVAARPGTMFKIDYWIKLVRLHARRVALPNLGRSVSNTLESVAKYILDAGPRPFVLLISLAFSAFFHLTAKGQTAGFSLLALALFLPLSLKGDDPVTNASPSNGRANPLRAVVRCRPYLVDRLLEYAFCVLSGNPYLILIYPLFCGWSYWMSPIRRVLALEGRQKLLQGCGWEMPAILPNLTSLHSWGEAFRNFCRRSVGWKESADIARLLSLSFLVALIHTIGDDGFVSVFHDAIHPTLEDCDEFFFALFVILLFAASLVFSGMANRAPRAGVAARSVHPG